MMKHKFSIALAAALLACTTASGQTVKQMFDEFGQAKHAETILVTPTLMKLANIFVDDNSGTTEALAKKISSVHMLNVANCRRSVRKRFAKQAATAGGEGYEPMLTVNSGDERVRILGKQDGDTFVDLVIFYDERTMLQLTGNFTKDDLERLAKQMPGK